MKLSETGHHKTEESDDKQQLEETDAYCEERRGIMK